MKAIKVSFINIIKAQNAIDDNVLLSKELFQAASNYWIIDVDSDEELNKVLSEIEIESDKCHFNYTIENVEGAK